ncbi:MAG TPA: hypothetical protein VI854_03560, partial [Acidimicrobiia bacterium]|nr:hypothetical protein [Acidimicrobiia bacterium]
MPPPALTAPPAPRSRRGGRVAALGVAALVLLGPACTADVTVSIEVQGRTGTVTARLELDREAVAVLGGKVAEGAQLDDLRRAGWEITGPRDREDGGAVVEASKAFGRAGDLGRVVEELSGPSGPLRRFRLVRDRSFTGVR